MCKIAMICVNFVEAIFSFYLCLFNCIFQLLLFTANENNEAAMGCYTNVLITGSEYCTLHLQRPVIDDHIVKRMIKCCLNLGCNMQAAILCQVNLN